MSSASVAVRPASSADIPAINAIHRHYVLNSISTFALEPLSDHEAASKLVGIQQNGLPYLVALDGGVIVGYTYLSPFRTAKGGYLHTAELSLYCQPQSTSRGVGTILLNNLLDVLDHPETYDTQWIGESRREEGRVRQVLSVMAVDPDGRNAGLGLVEWYKRFGFIEQGKLNRVGWKFDRWIDTVYLQRHIE